MFELPNNSVVICWAQKMLEFSEHTLVLSWIEFHIFFAFKILNLEEKLLKIRCVWN